ncbi:MAG: hypothetical protein M1820_010603 [Bogoriella megaspora]|nr:MAG: hypothetical protein M1820_010603 [Bogoriella megaspora]
MAPTVFLTGPTGFIGFAFLCQLLVAGCDARAGLRTADSRKVLLAKPRLVTISPDSRLVYIEIPDILARDAYHGKLNEVVYVIHVASPLPNPSKDVIEPSIRGIANILTAAPGAPQIHRAVLTSSIIANMDYPPLQDSGDTHGSFTGSATRARKNCEPLDGISHIQSTCRKRDGSICFVFGRHSRVMNLDGLLRGSNNLLLERITGNVNSVPQMSSSAHIADVGEVNLLTLDENKVQPDQSLGIIQPVLYDEAWDVVQDHFSKEVDRGLFAKGSQKDLLTKWDTSKGQNLLGRNFKDFQRSGR